MMKQSLKEQIARINNLIHTTNLNEAFEKADILSSNVDDFYKTLEAAAKSGGLSQEKAKQYKYQKGVEALQIGLVLLGYQLTKFGIDGKFGPETANAVQQFKKDNNILNEDAAEIRDALYDTDNDEKGEELDSGGEVVDELSSIVADIIRKYNETNPDVLITVTAGNDKFHRSLSYTSKHTAGRAIDLTLKPYDRNSSASFTNLLTIYKKAYPKFNFLDEYKNPSKESTAGHFHLEYNDGEVSAPKDREIVWNGTTSTTGAVATGEVITKLVDLLKQKNISQEDLAKFTKK